MAGNISVPRSIARISCTGIGRGKAKRTKAMKGRISGILLARMYTMNFCNYSAYQKQLIDIDFHVIGTSDY